MLPSVSVNPHDVRTVLRQDPHLLGPNDELVKIRQIEVPRKSRWNSAVGYRVREQILVSLIEVRLIKSFPLGVIGRM